MKIKRGLNPDFADYDEIDTDVVEAYEDFDSGHITYEQFKAEVGPDAAAAYAEKYAEDSAFRDLFDDPEDFA
jgi:hypothetical protein